MMRPRSWASGTARAWNARIRTRLLLRRQAGKADSSAVHLVTDIQPDQQRRDRLDDARVLQFAAVQRADSGNLRGQLHRQFPGVFVVAANQHVAVNWSIAR